MMHRDLRRTPVLLSSFIVFMAACGGQPMAPTAMQASAAGGADAGSCAGCTEPTLHLAIEPATVLLGAAILRNGVPVHPATFTVVLRETAGVPITLNGYFFELRSAAGVVLSRVDAGAWTKPLPAGTTWKMLDQTMYVGDRQSFGAGTLTVRIRAIDPAGKSHEVTATAVVQ